MATGNGNVRAYKKPINLNIGMIFFAVILLYVIICVCIYFNKKQIYGYEVKTGSLSETNVYEAIALREETVINSSTAGYINYFAKEGERIGAYQLVCTVDESGQTDISFILTGFSRVGIEALEEAKRHTDGASLKFYLESQREKENAKPHN